MCVPSRISLAQLKTVITDSETTLKTPFGPPPITFPPLSNRALLFLWSQLYLEEKKFLTKLPTIYDLNGGSALDQGCAFECLAFAAGLKECLLLGWGDGRTKKDREVAAVWLQDVWEEVLKVFKLPGMELDGDTRAVADFMEGCRTHQLGKIETESAIQEGHTVLYHEPASPALKTILDTPADSARSVHVDEAAFALILDYPAPMPPFRYFETTIPRLHRMSVTYHISATGPWCGTQYFTHRSDSILKTRIIPHYMRYAKKLHKVVVIGLSVDGANPTCALEPRRLEDVGEQSMNVKVFELMNLTTEGRRNPTNHPTISGGFENLSLEELREGEAEDLPEGLRRRAREEKDKELRRRGEQSGAAGPSTPKRSRN